MVPFRLLLPVCLVLHVVGDHCSHPSHHLGYHRTCLFGKTKAQKIQKKLFCQLALFPIYETLAVANGKVLGLLMLCWDWICMKHMLCMKHMYMKEHMLCKELKVMHEI